MVTGTAALRLDNATGFLPDDAVVALGIDPGPTTGICLVLWVPSVQRAALDVRAVQVPAAMAAGTLEELLNENGHVITCGQVEEFRSGRRSARLAGTKPDVTRNLVTGLSALAREHGVILKVRPAGLVKPWATDRRLEAAGLLAPTKGKTHARDGARHAVFAAVADGGMKDPMFGYRAPGREQQEDLP